uniref:Amidase domain-containing protein n=1 Tax=Taeniopygia guttata TaxID=59729 RepID=H1A3L8_TAEGU
MTQEQLWHVLDPSWGDLPVMLLKWLGRRQVQQKMDERRRSWHLALERMEKAACRLKQGTQTSQILSLTVVELEEKLKEVSLSPESVLYSYMDKALEMNQEVNCMTEFIHGCEDQLQKQKKQKEKGLLCGIPISIKDHINCKGHISSGGMVKFLGQVKEEDSIIVQVLKHHGGIPFVKTNISQTMMNAIYNCSSLIFGQTLNPLNPQKNPRGSSGGEAALMAGGGSILGTGLDVAGSILLPCSFCGVCSLKPTGSRISTQGVIGALTGMPSVLAGTSWGHGKGCASLALCTKALLCQEMPQVHPTVPPIPFHQQVRLRGISKEMFSSSMKWAVQHMRKLLQGAGHTVGFHIDYVVDELFTRGIFSDGVTHLVDCFKGDIVDPNLKSQYNTDRLPALVKRMLAIILKPIYPRIAQDLSTLCGGLCLAVPTHSCR